MKKKEQMEKLLGYIEKIKDNNGRAVIDVNIEDKHNIYNPLSYGENLDLNEEIYSFIDSQTNVIPAEIPLVVRFHGKVDENEQDKIKNIMQQHYTLKSFDILWDVAANMRKMVALCIFGVLVLAAYFYISFTSGNVMFAEILSIIGSFSLWEAADAFLLERPRLRRERRNLEQNIKQSIEFIDDIN